MYIRTPKRYRGRSRRGMFSCGRIFLSLIMLSLIVVGIGIYQNRDMITPYVDTFAATAMSDVNSRVSTSQAPLPTVTPDPALNLVTGANAWERGDVSTALLAYEQIIGGVPNDVEVHERLTTALLTRGQTAEALQMAENTVTADPFNSDAWATLALAHAYEDEDAEALVAANQALEIDPDNGRANAYLAWAYIGLEQYGIAETNANAAISKSPERFEGYWVRAILRENITFDFQGALSDYQTAYDYAQEQDPALAGTIAGGIARTYLTFFYRDIDGAVSVLEAARAVDPDNVDTLYWLGNVQLVERGDFGQAQEILEDCVRVSQMNINCHYLLGRAQARGENTSAALQSFLQAVELDTRFARHYWWAAEMYIVGEGTCAEAVPLLERGYRMAIDGDLPAADEGNQSLIDAFVARLDTCRVGIVPTATPEPELETEDPLTDTSQQG